MPSMRPRFLQRLKRESKPILIWPAFMPFDLVEEKGSRKAMPADGVRREKATLSTGCKPHAAKRSSQKQLELWR